MAFLGVNKTAQDLASFSSAPRVESHTFHLFPFQPPGEGYSRSEKKSHQLIVSFAFPNHRISRLILKVTFHLPNRGLGGRGHTFLLGQESPSPGALHSTALPLFSGVSLPCTLFMPHKAWHQGSRGRGWRQRQGSSESTEWGKGWMSQYGTLSLYPVNSIMWAFSQ